MSDDGPAVNETARIPERPRGESLGAGSPRRGPAAPAPARGLFGAMVGALVRRAGEVLGNTAQGAAPVAAPVCSICGKGAREGLHVAPVFRLRSAAVPDAPSFLLVPVDRAGRQSRPLCLACATSLVGDRRAPGALVEVEA